MRLVCFTVFHGVESCLVGSVLRRVLKIQQHVITRTIVLMYEKYMLRFVTTPFAVLYLTARISL